jgi:hypothetical protein
VQALADVHDTPDRTVFDAPAGLGVVWIDHLLPSQRSASVTVVVPLEEWPTAVQALADVHDTPDRTVFDAPAGLGVVWIDHLLPFQPSASATSWVPVPCSPTALQALADAQDTPWRMLYGWWGLGVCWIDQPEAAAAAALTSRSTATADTAIANRLIENPASHQRLGPTCRGAGRRADHTP